MESPILVLVLGLSRETDGEGNGTPLQYSCLENPMDEEAWWGKYTVSEMASAVRQAKTDMEAGPCSIGERHSCVI